MYYVHNKTIIMKDYVRLYFGIGNSLSLHEKIFDGETYKTV